MSNHLQDLWQFALNFIDLEKISTTTLETIDRFVSHSSYVEIEFKLTS